MKVEDYNDRKNILTRLARNSFFLIASRVIDIGVVIITVPVIARYLGLKTFGDYALVTALTIFLGPLVEFGTENIICRDISKDKKNASKYINSAIVIRALFSFFVVSIYYASAKLLFPDNMPVQRAILISALTESIISLSMVFFPVIRAYERMEYELLSNFFNKIFFAIAVLIVVFLDYGFLALFYAKLLSSFVLLLLALFFVFKRLIIFQREFSWKLAVSLLKQGLPVAVVVLFGAVSSKVDIYFLKYFKNSAEIALFEVSNRLIGQLQFIPFSVVTTLIPFFSRISTGPAPGFKLHYQTVIKFLYIGSVFAVMLMVTGADVIIVTLFGAKFQPSALSFKIISWIFIFFSLNYFLHQILIIQGRQRIFSLFAWGSFLVNATLDVLLIPSYGYIGASIATLTSCLLLFVASMIYVSLQIGGINIREVFVKPSLSISLAWAASYLLYNNSIISLITIGCLGLFIYISFLLLIRTFSENELKFIREIIIKRKRLAASETGE